MVSKDHLRKDLTTNLKAHNELEVTVLRSVLGEIQTQEKSGKTAVEFNDKETENILAKEVKKRRDTANIWLEAGILVRAQRETAEADFLATYLPAPLTQKEVTAAVNTALANFKTPTMRDFGAIMKTVIASTRGQADGKIISELVKQQLSHN